MKESQNKDFKISVRTLQKQFLCNICFNEIEDCYITRCGHIYCKACIYQAINRHHRCPFCNVQLTENDLFKNYHFNTLRKIVNKEKEEAASAYLEKVFEQEQLVQSALMQPVEKLILSCMKQSLLTYRKYINDTFENMQKNEQRKAAQKKSDSRLKTTQQLIKEIHRQIIPHIKSPVISPILIPQRVLLNMQMPAPIKGISISQQITSMTPIAMIVSAFERHMKENNIRLQYTLPQDKVQVTVGENTYKLDDLLGEAVLKLADSSANVNIIGMTPVRNMECYSYKWHNGKSVNYYSCRQCNLNWICEVCKDYCHEGHPNVMQLKDHVPNWACCYCVTKCDCKALNKNSQI